MENEENEHPSEQHRHYLAAPHPKRSLCMSARYSWPAHHEPPPPKGSAPTGLQKRRMRAGSLRWRKKVGGAGQRGVGGGQLCGTTSAALAVPPQDQDQDPRKHQRPREPCPPTHLLEVLDGSERRGHRAREDLLDALPPEVLDVHLALPRREADPHHHLLPPRLQVVTATQQATAAAAVHQKTPQSTRRKHAR